MRMTLMYQNRPCTAIDVNFLQNKIKIQNYTKDILHRAFGIKEDPTWEDFCVFLQDRCFPKTRGNVKAVLAGLGLQDYDQLQIVEKTNGRTAEDDLWLKFQEVVRGYSVVKTRRYAKQVFTLEKRSQKVSLSSINNAEKRNNVQLKNLLDTFPDIPWDSF